MATYTVQDTTMTALGDAVRSKVGNYVVVDEIPTPTFDISIDTTTMEPIGTYIGQTYHEVPLNLKEIFGEDYSRIAKLYVSGSYESYIRGFNYSIFNLRLQFRETETETVSGGAHIDIVKGNSSNPLTGDITTYLDFANVSSDHRNLPYTSIQLKVNEWVYRDNDGWYKCNLKIWVCDADNKFIVPNTMTPAEMVDTINSWDMSAIDRYKYFLEGKTYFSIPASDLTGLTEIRNQTAYNFPQITGLELPEGITKIGDYAFTSTAIKELVLPASLSSIQQYAFSSNLSLKTVRILNDKNVITINPLAPPFQHSSINSIYVPSKLYDQYCTSSGWMSYKEQYIPYGEWVFDKNLSAYLEYDTEKEYTISLLEFTSTPDFSITLDKNEYAEITDISINDDNTEITFKVKTLNSDGVETLTVIVYGEEQIYTLTGTITVMETIPEPTYEVVAVDGASYGFALNDNGYYESQNKGKSSTYALCQVNISNLLGTPIYFDCISYGESNYDFGLLGVVNNTLLLSDTIDSTGIKKNFRGASSPNIQTVEYTDASGDCFIQIKYRKDGSGDQGNDTLQFKIRFK